MKLSGAVRTIAAIATLMATVVSGAAQDALKLAIGQRGPLEGAVAELGQNAGIFKKHGIVLDILYTQGTGETMQATISGAADIGVSIGTFGAMGSFSKGAPVRIIGTTMTGGNDIYWYVRNESPIKSMKDMAGRTIAYSTAGSSTHQTVLALSKHFDVEMKPVATGGPPGTFVQVMSGQIEMGWSAVPFGVEAMDKGEIRMIATANDIPRFRDQTIRVIVANANSLKARRDVFVRFMRAYREAVDWIYNDPASGAAYAQWAKIPESISRRVRQELTPRADLDPDRFEGLESVMSDAIQFKFLSAPLTKGQLSELIQIPFK